MWAVLTSHPPNSLSFLFWRRQCREEPCEYSTVIIFLHSKGCGLQFITSRAGIPRKNPWQWDRNQHSTKHLAPRVAVVVFLIYVHSRLTLPSLRHLLLFIFLNLLYPFFDRPAHPTLPTITDARPGNSWGGFTGGMCVLFISGPAAPRPSACLPR